MSDKHSDQSILEAIQSSQHLAKKVNDITSDMQQNLRKEFKKKFTIDVPSALVALVLQEDTTLQFASKSLIGEYTTGLAAVLGPTLDGKYPEAALAATSLVGKVLDNIVGSSSVGSSQQFDSSQTDDNGVSVISAVMITSQKISKSDWKVSQDFFVSAYLLVVFKDPAQSLTSA